MRAVIVDRHGDPEVMKLCDVADPSPRAGEVLIRTEAIGVNFHDVWVVGSLPGFVDLPIIQGIELAGVVEDVGPDLNREQWQGRRVAAIPVYTHGAYAQRAVVSSDLVYEIPDRMPMVEAAAFPLTFLMAHAALHFSGRLQKGEKVLVHAAAGGVGSAAVQLAAHAGAKVIGTASTAKHDVLRKLGASPVDYRKGDWVEAVTTASGGAGVDLVIDGVGEEGFERSLNVLRFGGRLVAFGVASLMNRDSATDVGDALDSITFSFSQLNAKALGVHTSHLGGPPTLLRSWMKELLTLYNAGVIRPLLDRTYPLEDAAVALRRLLERKNIGKVVLIP